jgi:hypothetical protein
MKTNVTVNGMNGILMGFPPNVLQYALIAFAALQLVIIFLLAVAVKNDAEVSSGRLFLLSPWMWFFVVIMTGGYAGALGYWLVHYSALRYQEAKRA